MNLSSLTQDPNLQTDTEKSSLKRPVWELVFDYGISMLALLVFAPLFLVICLFTKLVSKGPTLFKQRRIGYNGQPFAIYKFRTMHLNASTADHEDHTTNLIKSNRPMVKMDAKGDDRIIPLGRLLRASGFDELPQILNVLKGEMSIVGPRPCLSTEYAEYTSQQEERCETFPGLTGLWQVSGKNRLTFDEMIECDIRYARQKSARMYLLIIIKTPMVLIQQIVESRKRAQIIPMPSVTNRDLEKTAVGQ